MSVTVRDHLSSSAVVAVREVEAHGRFRAQGWLIMLGASAVLWTGIISAIVGIAELVR